MMTKNSRQAYIWVCRWLLMIGLRCAEILRYWWISYMFISSESCENDDY